MVIRITVLCKMKEKNGRTQAVATIPTKIMLFNCMVNEISRHYILPLEIKWIIIITRWKQKKKNISVTLRKLASIRFFIIFFFFYYFFFAKFFHCYRCSSSSPKNMKRFFFLFTFITQISTNFYSNELYPNIVLFIIFLLLWFSLSITTSSHNNIKLHFLFFFLITNTTVIVFNSILLDSYLPLFTIIRSSFQIDWPPISFWIQR